MRIEDIEVGMEVKAFSKSIGESLVTFERKTFGSCVGWVDSIKGEGCVLVVLAENHHVPFFYFEAADLIPAKIANQTGEDFKPGMKVKAHRKSITPVNWNSFLHYSSDGSGEVKYARPDCVCVMCEGRSFDFAPTDLEILEPVVMPLYCGDAVDAKSYLGRSIARSIIADRNVGRDSSWDIPEPVPQEIKGLKPITLKAILEAGADPCCVTYLDFVQAMLAIRAEYLWEEIPPEAAQEAAEDLGYPAWFAACGFLQITEPESEKSKQFEFDVDEVALTQRPGSVLLTYVGVPILHLSADGVYRCQAVLSDKEDFPVALESSPVGYFKVKIQN